MSSEEKITPSKEQQKLLTKRLYHFLNNTHDHSNHLPFYRPWYCGDKLCYKLDNNQMVMLEVGDPHLSDELSYIVAKFYIYYKSPYGARWTLANRIVKDHEESKQVITTSLNLIDTLHWIADEKIDRHTLQSFYILWRESGDLRNDKTDSGKPIPTQVAHTLCEIFKANDNNAGEGSFGNYYQAICGMSEFNGTLLVKDQPTKLVPIFKQSTPCIAGY